MSAAQMPKIYTPGEVARLFRVTPKTVSRWVLAGRVPACADGRPGFFRTLGGHLRFHGEVIDAIVDRGSGL